MAGEEEGRGGEGERTGEQGKQRIKSGIVFIYSITSSRPLSAIPFNSVQLIVHFTVIITATTT